MNKFRVYDALSKHYVTDEAPWIITVDGQLGVMNSILPRNDFILEKCTGICDKNGTYIYDGDIVKEGVVKNYLGYWYIEPKGQDCAELMTRYNYQYEIVGNIHTMDDTKAS